MTEISGLARLNINGQNFYNEDMLVEALACIYPNSNALVAHLCDEHLDRSGRLLGLVRDRHVERSQELIEVTDPRD